jgi:hypothetical protein
MLTAFVVFTIPIFTILFILTVGIMIPIIMDMHLDGLFPSHGDGDIRTMATRIMVGDIRIMDGDTHIITIIIVIILLTGVADITRPIIPVIHRIQMGTLMGHEDLQAQMLQVVTEEGRLQAWQRVLPEEIKVPLLHRDNNQEDLLPLRV